MSFKIVLTGVNSLAALLGQPVKFQMVGVWTRDYQDPLGVGYKYHAPDSPALQPGLRQYLRRV